MGGAQPAEMETGRGSKYPIIIYLPKTSTALTATKIPGTQAIIEYMELKGDFV